MRRHWKHSRKYVQTAIRTAASSKNQQKHEQNCNSVSTSNTDIQIPRVNACESRPQLSKSANLAKFSRHSSKKQCVSTSKSKNTDKTCESWGGQTDRQTDRRTGSFLGCATREFTVCVRACVHASKAKQFPVLDPPNPPTVFYNEWISDVLRTQRDFFV